MNRSKTTKSNGGKSSQRNSYKSPDTPENLERKTQKNENVHRNIFKKTEILEIPSKCVGSENEPLENLSNLKPNRAQFDCPSISAHHDLLWLVGR
ncbi:uncharacterized protein Dsimw501_GD27068 [Drosophila simulans]|uniref:Uncharacterized protein n=1 Tax=Drosophila simulans TaxID=7240 RepID=A0A0J9R3S6_DROSI|nr:uncharacterized protein Dsimw501_GD27068 [Drosophila simulans]